MVRIGDAGTPADPGQATSAIVCDNNLLHGGGRIFPGAVGIWVGNSGGNRVTHNDLSDLFYSGISVGWSWGYDPTLSQNNTIDFNHIHHLGWGVLSDMGGVYTLGLAAGSTISNNVIHDVYSSSFGGWGIYNDEGSSDYVIENNLVYRTKTGSYFLHYGENNLVRNNIFALAMAEQIQGSRVEEHRGFTFENNLVYWNGGPLFTGTSKFGRNLFRRNLWWDASGAPVRFGNLTHAQWQAQGQDEGGLVADPLFVDPEQGDFHLRPGSPVAQVSFRPFDYTQAGLYGDPAWVARARALSYPPVEFAPR